MKHRQEFQGTYLWWNNTAYVARTHLDLQARFTELHRGLRPTSTSTRSSA
ncbi:hypothetical protein [Streptomyces sp. NPDC008137]